MKVSYSRCSGGVCRRWRYPAKYRGLQGSGKLLPLTVKYFFLWRKGSFFLYNHIFCCGTLPQCVKLAGGTIKKYDEIFTSWHSLCPRLCQNWGFFERVDRLFLWPFGTFLFIYEIDLGRCPFGLLGAWGAPHYWVICDFLWSLSNLKFSTLATQIVGFDTR